MNTGSDCRLRDWWQDANKEEVQSLIPLSLSVLLNSLYVALRLLPLAKQMHVKHNLATLNTPQDAPECVSVTLR